MMPMRRAPDREPKIPGCALLLFIVVALIVYAALLRGAHAQEPDARGRIEHAMRARLRVWERPDGTPVYAGHCRRAAGGCEARLRRLSTFIVASARVHDVDPWVLAAIAVRESGANPNALGARGEFGVMQLHPASRHGRSAMALCAGAPGTCPRIDVDAAAVLLRAGRDRCGSISAALGLYNSGRCGETAYSASVLRMRELLMSAR